MKNKLIKINSVYPSSMKDVTFHCDICKRKNLCEVEVLVVNTTHTINGMDFNWWICNECGNTNNDELEDKLNVIYSVWLL